MHKLAPHIALSFVLPCLAGCASDEWETTVRPGNPKSEAARIAAESEEIVDACSSDPNREVFVETPIFREFVPCSSVLAMPLGRPRARPRHQDPFDDPFFERDWAPGGGPGGTPGGSGGGVRMGPFGVACAVMTAAAAASAEKNCRLRKKGAGGAGPSEEDIQKCIDRMNYTALGLGALCIAI
jgi:hypothetical protein